MHRFCKWYLHFRFSNSNFIYAFLVSAYLKLFNYYFISTDSISIQTEVLEGSSHHEFLFVNTIARTFFAP